MNMKKKKYISPWIQTVPLDMAEDIMLRISSEAVDPTDPGFEWGVKEFDEWNDEDGPSYDGSSDIWEKAW